MTVARPKKRLWFTLFCAGLGGAVACGANGPDGPDSACTFTLSPQPGMYASTITISIIASDPVNYSFIANSEALPADPFPTNPEDSEAPASYSRFAGDIELAQGQLLFYVQDPCAGGWQRYAYFVDPSPPSIYLSQQGGAFREAVTVNVATDDLQAQIFARIVSDVAADGDFALVTDTISIGGNGSYTLQAKALDRLNRFSDVVTATYVISPDVPWLSELSLVGGVNAVSPLPKLIASFDRRMATDALRLNDAIRVVGDSDSSFDLLLFWRNAYGFFAYPDGPLPANTPLVADLAGLKGATGLALAKDPVSTTVFFTTGDEALALELQASYEATAVTVPAVGTARVFVRLDPAVASLDNYSVVAFDGRGSQAARPLTTLTLTHPVNGDQGLLLLEFDQSELRRGLTTRLGLVLSAANHQYRENKPVVLYARDLTPPSSPTTLQALPVPGSVAPPSVLAVVGNQPISTPSLSSATLVLSRSGVETPLAFSVDLASSGDGKTAIITPAQAFQVGDAVTFTSLTGSVFDVWGRPFLSGLNASWQMIESDALTPQLKSTLLTGGQAPLLPGDFAALWAGNHLDIEHAGYMQEVSTGHQLAIVALTPQRPQLRNGDATAAQTAIFTLPTWFNPPDDGWRFQIPFTTTTTSPTNHVLALTTNSEAPAIRADLVNGKGAIVRRDGNVALFAEVGLALGNSDFASAPTVGLSPPLLTPPTLLMTAGSSWQSGVSVNNALTIAIPQAAPDYTGPITASFWHDDQGLGQRELYLFGNDQVPSLLAPAAATSVSGEVEFSWSVSDASAGDAIALKFFSDSFAPALELRYPAGATQASIDVDALLGSGSYYWLVALIKSQTEPYLRDDGLEGEIGYAASDRRAFSVP